VSRVSDAKHGNTRLVQDEETYDFRVRLDERGRCPLERVAIPQVVNYTLIGRPGSYEHITLEEADAMIWGSHCRLRRPKELGSRISHGGDNAPHVVSSMQGRSSARRLNGKCRKACSIELAGNFVCFQFWTSTHTNPADPPSSWFGLRANNTEYRKNMLNSDTLVSSDVYIPSVPGG
jgi:hypothetical protein